MMIAIIIKQISDKLSEYVQSQGGDISVSPEWVNNWLNTNNAPFVAKIVDEDGNELTGAQVIISQKTRS